MNDNFKRKEFLPIFSFALFLIQEKKFACKFTLLSYFNKRPLFTISKRHAQ